MNKNATGFAGGSDNQRVPSWILGSYFGWLALGGLVNLVVFVALLWCKRCGTFTLILLTTLVDMVSTYVAVTEILVLDHRTWFLHPDLCPLFKGSEVFANSLSVYMLICFNFHVVSLWNLHETEVKKNNRNPLTSFSTSREDSNECLVTKQENRIVNIDYRKRKNDVSVMVPAMFMLIVSLSLSIPNFTLSSTLKMNQKHTLCAVIDVFYGRVLQHLLAAFKIAIPTFLLTISLVLLLMKLRRTRGQHLNNVLTKRFAEIKSFIATGIALTTVYMLTSFQRHLYHFIYIISYTFIDNQAASNNFKMPPLYNSYLNDSTITYFAMLHYGYGTLRGLLYVGMLPSMRCLLRTRFFKIEK